MIAKSIFKGSLFLSFMIVEAFFSKAYSNPHSNLHRTAKTHQSPGSDQDSIKTLSHYDKTRVSVIGALDTYNCNSDNSKCEKITYFNVDDDQTNNCYQERLIIHYDTTLLQAGGHKQAVAGYLKPYGFDNSIEKTQRKNKLCQLIKRYSVYTM